MKILFLGDMVGKGSRQAAIRLVPRLREELGCSLVIANGENMAGGGGITQKCISHVAPAGIDVFTGGDHMWDQSSLELEIKNLPNVLRPANFSPVQPGRGFGVFTASDGTAVGVICLLGRTFINTPADCPFRAADYALSQLGDGVRVIIVDIHAEATSEKIAMGRFLDGRVSAVLGTHTHVETADERIFPGGTAFQSDVGMVGASESILGRAIEPVVRRFSTGMPSRFTVVEKGIELHATLVEIDPANGHAVHIERIKRFDSGE